MRALFIRTVQQQAAAIARQRIGADNRQRAFSIALTVRAQVMPLNISAKCVAQRLYVTGRAGVDAVR